MNEEIYVLDANCLISANLIFTSVNRQAYEKAFSQGIVVYSPSTLNEFESVFLREKFGQYVSINDRKNLIQIFKQDAYEIYPMVKIQACRDPNDDKYLELAYTANATRMITGDKDLLLLHPFKGIPIVTPADFLKLF